MAETLEAHLRALIRADGPLSVAQYMALALGHPTLGYYPTRDPLGRAGDFTTAPEISQMFGELIGLWAGQVWLDQGRPGALSLLELGPGRGTLMADALRALAVVPGFREAAHIHLVETSPSLRARQRDTLHDTAPQWHDTLEAALAAADGPILVIANEFFDALPIRQFVKAPDGWRERLVGLDATGALCFALAPGPVPLPAAPSAPDGALWEVGAAGEAIAATLGAALSKRGGAALFIDYGHAVSAPGETLQAVKGHRPHGVLDDPGQADLTAHVDFAALARAARSAGAAVYGPLEQGAFLGALGIHTRAERLAAARPDQAKAVQTAHARLTGPEAMGRLFKVMALSPPSAPPPPPFEPTPMASVSSPRST